MFSFFQERFLGITYIMIDKSPIALLIVLVFIGVWLWNTELTEQMDPWEAKYMPPSIPGDWKHVPTQYEFETGKGCCLPHKLLEDDEYWPKACPPETSHYRHHSKPLRHPTTPLRLHEPMLTTEEKITLNKRHHQMAGHRSPMDFVEQPRSTTSHIPDIAALADLSEWHSDPWDVNLCQYYRH